MKRNCWLPSVSIGTDLLLVALLGRRLLISLAGTWGCLCCGVLGLLWLLLGVGGLGATCWVWLVVRSLARRLLAGITLSWRYSTLLLRITCQKIMSLFKRENVKRK